MITLANAAAISKTKIETLEHGFGKRVRDWYSACCQLGLLPYIYEGFRTNARQNELYLIGRPGGTPGKIVTNAQAVFLPDANFVVSGHTHDEWLMTIQRSRLSDEGIPYQDEQLHIRAPGYKDEYGDGHEGWHIRGGRPPKPLGAVWLRFYCEAKTIKYQAIRAK